MRPPQLFRVKTYFADSGSGILPEHLSRIFDPYFSTKPGATGLGLATAYSIVKNHGGFLAVESQIGSGTTMQLAPCRPLVRPWILLASLVAGPRGAHGTHSSKPDRGTNRGLVA